MNINRADVRKCPFVCKGNKNLFITHKEEILGALKETLCKCLNDI